LTGQLLAIIASKGASGVACVVISRSEKELDVDNLHEPMAHPIALGEEMETSPA
jgi:hypothetical protein